MKEGKFIRLPLLDGANSDEGSNFGVTGVDNETAVFNSLLSWRSYAIVPNTARKLLELYPNDPANEPPYYIKNATIFPNKGLQWRRSASSLQQPPLMAIVRHCTKHSSKATGAVPERSCKRATILYQERNHFPKQRITVAAKRSDCWRYRDDLRSS